jgi:hypothetical protein
MLQVSDAVFVVASNGANPWPSASEAIKVLKKNDKTYCLGDRAGDFCRPRGAELAGQIRPVGKKKGPLCSGPS